MPQALEPYTVISHIFQEGRSTHYLEGTTHDLKALVERFSITRCDVPIVALSLGGYSFRDIPTIHTNVLEDFTRALLQFYDDHEEIIDLVVTSNYGDGNGDILSLSRDE